MAQGFDCATPLTASLAESFAADGHQFVGRYLVPDGWKKLTKDEADTIQAAGLRIVSVFETTANRALGGAAAGSQDGATALECAQAVGQPAGSAIYFAVDFDATADQFDGIEAYLRAAAPQIPGYNVGVYGSYAVVEAMAARAACSYFWQTLAWSGGKRSAHAQLYQSAIDTVAHGIGVDWDESNGDEGGWNTVMYAELQAKIDTLQNQVDALTKLAHMECPDWAKEAVDAAVQKGLVNNPEGGSYDFYRFVTILHRKGII